jgi:hypothetical protein
MVHNSDKFTLREKSKFMNDIAVLSLSAKSLIAEALRALRESTGIAGEMLIGDSAETSPAVALEVGGKTLQYSCELKQKIDRYLVLDDLKARSVVSQSTLLVAGPLTEAMASRCRELDVQFIDTAGNAYLTDGRGILINVVGRKLEKNSPSATGEMTITPAALRMMFAFLATPSMLNAPYRDISAAVQVSTGVIGKVFDVLEARGFIGTAPGGDRIITSPEFMLSEWATGYMSRLRPKLKKFRFTSADPSYFHMGWDAQYRVSTRALWGGEVAAEKITKHLNPATFSIYLDMEQEPGALPDMVKQFKLRADPLGPIEVVQPFWNMDYFAESFPTVPLHLVYADLLGTNEPRNLRVASQISHDVIKHVHDAQR